MASEQSSTAVQMRNPANSLTIQIWKEKFSVAGFLFYQLMVRLMVHAMNIRKEGMYDSN